MKREKSYFKEKIVIVTGGASGIGKEMCMYLVKKGATVIIADKAISSAQVVSDEIKNMGFKAYSKAVDVTKKDDVERLVQETVEEHSKIDLLINNAGIGLDGELKDCSLNDFMKVMDVNFNGVLYGTYLVYPIMLNQGYGQIVNVSSLAGLLPGGLMTSYVASKHAVVGFSLTLRAEALQYGIKVNALCPGFIETPIHDNTYKASDYLNCEQNQKNKNIFPQANAVVGKMMQGIIKNKAIIVVPKIQKIFWFLYRLFPSLIPFLWSKMIKKLKK